MSARELPPDVAVFTRVDRSKVTLYEDGTHEGPAVTKHTGRVGGCDFLLYALYCPCGHYLGERTARYVPDTVTCTGSI